MLATGDIRLRETVEADLQIFFEHYQDPDANRMAAFTARDPSDRDAFMAHWARILADGRIFTRTILFDGRVAGSVLSFQQFGEPSVSYWIGKEYWGRGIATRALTRFLALVPTRPVYARAASDNVASLRVLEKCGFTVCGEERGFANARREEIDEVILRLDR